MERKIYLLTLVFIIAGTCNAQEAPSHLLTLGDTAPPLRVREWLKGVPVQRFEKSKLYVIEFWATWCKPCLAAMPHLSILAERYRDKVEFIGIDIYEKKMTSKEKIKAFVTNLGQRIDYKVAVEDSNYMETDWLDSFGERENGIPRTFVVNSEGKIAWIGHPKDVADVLSKMLDDKWDIKEVLAKKHFDTYLQHLDDSAAYELMNYVSNEEQNNPGKPDSALWAINIIVTKEPLLKYAPRIAFYTFSALLQIDQRRAYVYGKKVLTTTTYQDPDYNVIIGTIRTNSEKMHLSPEIYELGAEAYQLKLDKIPFRELEDIPELYSEMAEWYFRANNKSNAIDSQQKAIEALKTQNAVNLAALESRVQQYRKM